MLLSDHLFLCDFTDKLVDLRPGGLELRPVRLDLCTIIIVDVMVHINKIPSRKGEIYDVNPDLININVMNSCFVYMSSSIND